MGGHRAVFLAQARQVEIGAVEPVEIGGDRQRLAHCHHARAPDPGDEHAVSLAEFRQSRLGDGRQVEGRDAFEPARLPAPDRHETRAEPLGAGEVFVAARLIDAPLAAPFGLERLDRHAVGDLSAVAAPFADLGVDVGVGFFRKVLRHIQDSQRGRGHFTPYRRGYGSAISASAGGSVQRYHHRDGRILQGSEPHAGAVVMVRIGPRGEIVDLRRSGLAARRIPLQARPPAGAVQHNALHHEAHGIGRFGLYHPDALALGLVLRRLARTLLHQDQARRDRQASVGDHRAGLRELDGRDADLVADGNGGEGGLAPMVQAAQDPRAFPTGSGRAGGHGRIQSALRTRTACPGPCASAIWMAPMLLECASTSAIDRAPNPPCDS